ncbi:MAG: pyridoxal-phosphate dependent enzyme [Chitinophagales bacterium]
MLFNFAEGGFRKTHELCCTYPDKRFIPNQFSNKYNRLAHYETTANEIWENTEGKVTHFVSAVGTSGTLMGLGMGLKAKNPAIQKGFNLSQILQAKHGYIIGLFCTLSKAFHRMQNTFNNISSG